MGYDAEIRTFPIARFDADRWHLTGGENAAVVAGDQRFPGLPLALSVDGPATGPLVALEWGGGPLPNVRGAVAHLHVADADPDDWPLWQRLIDEVGRLAESGAVAVALSGWPGPLSDLLSPEGVQAPIPALVLSREDGQRLAQLEGGDAVTVDIEVEILESQNVVAELAGAGDTVVVLGAHYDAPPETDVAANDNGSGVAVLLSLAEAMSGRSPPYTLRFITFGAEELGLYGSTRYVGTLDGEEVGRLAAMLNFDVVGSGEHLLVSGHGRLAAEALSLAGDLGVPAERGQLPDGAGADHFPFDAAGVPALMFWAPDVSRIHTPDDRIQHIQPERLGGAFLVARALLESPNFP